MVMIGLLFVAGLLLWWWWPEPGMEMETPAAERFPAGEDPSPAAGAVEGEKVEPEPAAASPPEPAVESLGGGRYRIGRIEFDENERTITVPAVVHMHEGAVEYVLVQRHGKLHETVFVTDADAREVQLAALLLGAEPQPDLGPAGALEVGAARGIEAWVEWDRNGPPARIPLAQTVLVADPGSGATAGFLDANRWVFNGSRIVRGTFLASQSGSMVSIIRDPDALVNYPGASRENDEIHTPNAAALPKIGAPVRIVLRIPLRQEAR